MSMLSILRRVIQDVNAARDLDEVLEIVVRYIKESMEVDVASVYLTDFERGEHVLMVTRGLRPEAVGQVRLGLDEGLVGLAARRVEPINVAEARSHPHFRFFPESGEEAYSAFLGIPVIHQRKVLGVLVAQRAERKRFSEDKVAFLITLAAQLAGALAHAEASGGASVKQIRHSSRERFVAGVPGAPGVAVGTAVVVYAPADLRAVPDRKPESVQAEIEEFRDAVAATRTDVARMQARLGEVIPAEDRAIFDAYAMLLNSEAIVADTIEHIQAGNWAQGALREVIETHARRFEAMEDEYLSERAADIREIGRRILLQLQKGAGGPTHYPERTVLVGEEVGATQLADVPAERLAAVVSARGSSSSHVAILARAMGVPAVMGAEDVSIARVDGHPAIVDGYLGRVYLDPSAVVRKEYARLAEEETRLTEELQALRELPAETPDGKRIPLYVNTGLVADVSPTLESGAEGIGLYRTEFPFMIRERFPSEEEQRRIYRQCLEALAPRPVTLRTLDVGGDKALPYFPMQEDNPFLGWRGIRVTLDHPEIFITQLRAMLAAASGLRNLQILLPMISDVSEVDEALQLLDQALCELNEEGIPVERPQVGVMVEVPSAVYQSPALARRVDFLSIGTNDLTQYLLAVDRNNARVAELYNSLHPAVLNAINDVIQAGHSQRCPVSVCGGMAGDPGAAVLLMGMGIDSLSMTAASLPRVKWALRTITHVRARDLVREVLALESPGEVRSRLDQVLEENALGGLVRAGR